MTVVNVRPSVAAVSRNSQGPATACRNGQRHHDPPGGTRARFPDPITPPLARHRQSFANDLTYPQLIAVTDNVNQAKGDQDPTTWQPPLASYHCTYAKMWIASKYHWALKLQSGEKSALQSMLNTCAS
jgi:hypothetical protein